MSRLFDKMRRQRKEAPFNALKASYSDKTIGGADIPTKGLPADYIALKIDGDCLVPRAHDGEIVIAERKLPKPGELAVFWFKGRARPVVKVLRTRLDLLYPFVPGGNCVAVIEFEQSNPPKRYAVSIDEIECIARVHSVRSERGERAASKPAKAMAVQS